MRISYPDSSMPEIKELLAIVEPYAPYWLEWTTGGASFLSPVEITIIENFLVTGSHIHSSGILHIPLPTVTYIFRMSKLRLRQHTGQFESWLTENLLERHGLISYESDRDRFLNSPLKFLPIDYELRNNLCRFCTTNMSDLLSAHTLNSISNMWFMNASLIKELKQTLRFYECLDLLQK